MQPKWIFPIVNESLNWMNQDQMSKMRPPTPPRWATASFGRKLSFN